LEVVLGHIQVHLLLEVQEVVEDGKEMLVVQELLVKVMQAAHHLEIRVLVAEGEELVQLVFMAHQLAAMVVLA
jgi:hypothetical protein